jgi:prevent-host-death family protein
MRLGLREANQRFSQTIKAVRAGKEVILTDRGRPIAVITPMHCLMMNASATWF